MRVVFLFFLYTKRRHTPASQKTGGLRRSLLLLLLLLLFLVLLLLAFACYCIVVRCGLGLLVMLTYW